MSKPRDYHNAPPSHSATLHPESKPPLVDVAKQYCPSGIKEMLLATMSRVAVRLLDRVTGKTYSADELPAYLAPSVTAVIAADRLLLNPFDGAPVIFDDADAGAAMTGTYTADTDKTVALTAKVAGVLSPAPKLVITAADALPAGANAELAIVSQAANVVTVRPATGAGDQAHAHIETNGADQLTVGVAAATAEGPLGNAKRISIVNGTVGQADATATYVSPTITVALAMGSGTPASYSLADSSGSSAVTITAPATSQTAFNDCVVSVETQIGNTQSAYAALTGAATLKIYLATDSDGDVVPLDIPASGEATALTGLTGWPVGWTAVGTNEGTLDSYNAGGAMANGVAMVQLTTSKNQTTAIAALIHALGAGSGAVFTCTGAGNTGAGVVTVADNPTVIEFSDGGENSTITSNLGQLAALLHAAPSTIIDGVVGTGDDATLMIATTAPNHVTLTGGTNADPEHLGTPAKLGRLATDGTDVWTAMKDDLTGTDSTTWVKTFTATP